MSQQPSNPTNIEYTLGVIQATTTSTADDVKAIRVEVGDLARRVTAVEQSHAALIAERAPMVADYGKFVHKTNNLLMEHEAKFTKLDADQLITTVSGQSKLLNRLEGGWSVTRWVMGVFGVLFLFVAGQLWMDHRSRAQLEQKVEQVSDRPLAIDGRDGRDGQDGRDSRR